MCIYFVILPDSEPALCTTRATFGRIRDYPLFQLTGLLNRCWVGDRYPPQSEAKNTDRIYKLHWRTHDTLASCACVRQGEKNTECVVLHTNKAPRQRGPRIRPTRLRCCESKDSSLAAAQRISFLGDIGVRGELCMAVTLEMLFIWNLWRTSVQWVHSLGNAL